MAFFCKRRRKLITPFVVALWLFAIFVSVAHACGVDEVLGNASPSMSANIGAHDGANDGAPPNCDKFCAADLAVLAKLKAVQDLPTGEALLTPALADELFQTVVAPSPSLSRSPDPPLGIAINTHFVRLAL